MHISEPAEYAILGLLESKPMHGYEMFQQFENGTLRQIIHLEMSQMYAFFKKLERMKYIEAELEPQGSRPPRKIFHLTPAGREVFLQWLTEPVERPREIRILFLIKHEHCSNGCTNYNTSWSGQGKSPALPSRAPVPPSRAPARGAPTMLRSGANSVHSSGTPCGCQGDGGCQGSGRCQGAMEARQMGIGHQI